MPRWDENHSFSSMELTDEAIIYLTAIEKDLAHATWVQHRRSLQRFYLWLNITRRTISDLSPKMVEHAYPLWCRSSQKMAGGGSKHEYYRIRTYMIWLIRAGYLPGRKPTEFYPQSLKSIELPSCALEFIEQRKEVSKYAPRRYGQLFNLFHQWLAERDIELSELKREQIKSFLNFLDKRGYKPKPLHMRKLHTRIYLDWLRDRDLITCDCRDLYDTKEQFRNFTLPSFTEEYLSELRTHLSPETVKGYKTGISGFHRFLQRDQIPFLQLSRASCVHWMEWMFEKEYSASTRLQRIVTVKGYLAWIVDRKIHRFDVEDLLRSDDLPQLDDFLPRPLPLATDLEIQKRLLESEDVYHKAALLLRYTGLRLGDLERLAFNPIRVDEKNRSFLLIPPGKIKIERMLPIEERTILLIGEIQKKMAPIIRSWGGKPEAGMLFAGRAKKSSFHKIYRRFKTLTKDLETQEVGSIYPHRLRHTYATSLLNAGIHPAVLMVLLGHTDLRMTFRYARLSIELIHRAYFTAYEQIQKEIHFPSLDHNLAINTNAADPVALLQTVVKWINKENKKFGNKAVASVLNRLQKVIRDVQTLTKQDP